MCGGWWVVRGGLEVVIGWFVGWRLRVDGGWAVGLWVVWLLDVGCEQWAGRWGLGAESRWESLVLRLSD